MRSNCLTKAWLKSVIAALLVFTGAAIPASAADNKIQVSNPPSEFIIGDPNFPNPELTFTVLVSGPVAANIKLEFVDFIYGNNGGIERLPSDSTPYSLAKIFETGEFEQVYTSTSNTQRFTFTLVPKIKKIDQLYYGGIKVSMENRDSKNQKGTGSSSSTGSVVSIVNVTPFGFKGGKDGSELTGASLAGVSFKSSNRTSIIDYMIPDLPGLINSGPIEAKASYKNEGELPTFVTPSWKFLQGQKVLATKSASKTILIGGATKSQTVITQSEISGTDNFANVLPNFGVVEIETTLQSEIGGTRFEPVVQKSSVLIVQWKEPFFFISLALLILWYVGRRRPAKPGQKRKEPSLLLLAIKALRKELAKRLAKRKALKSPSV